MKRILSLILVGCLLCTACTTAPPATEPSTTVSTTVTEAVTSSTDTVETSGTDAVATVTESTTKITTPVVTTVTTSTTRETRTTTGTTTTTRKTTTAKTVSTTSEKPTTKTTVITTTTTTTTAAVTTTTEPPVNVISVLSVGNSLSFDAHTLLSRFANHEGVAMQTLSLMYSGCSLKKHYEFWQQNQAAYNPIVNGTADWSKKITLIDALTSQEWDVITIQESSTALSRENMISYGWMLYMIIKKYQPKAKLYIHQTWALGDGSKYHNDKTGGTMDAMWQITKPNYDALAEALKLPLIPSGEAMYNLQKAYDQRGLGESAYRDALHADLGWGAYMLALVWYRTITGETPSNTFDAFGPYIEDATVRKLVYDTAMNAVEAYQ